MSAIAGSAAAAALHELLLLGLSSKDSQCRARALHLLQASVQQGWGPQVRSSQALVQLAAYAVVYMHAESIDIMSKVAAKGDML